MNNPTPVPFTTEEVLERCFYNGMGVVPGVADALRAAKVKFTGSAPLNDVGQAAGFMDIWFDEIAKSKQASDNAPLLCLGAGMAGSALTGAGIAAIGVRLAQGGAVLTETTALKDIATINLGIGGGMLLHVAPQMVPGK